MPGCGALRAGGRVEFVQGAAVSGDPREDGGGVPEPDGAPRTDVDDALGRGERGGVHGAGHVAYVDEVALDAEPAELQLAVAGLHGAAHRLGEAAERGARGCAGSDGREDPQDDGVEAGAEHQLTGGQLAHAVRPAGPGHRVLGGGRAGLRGPVLGGAAELDEAGAAAAAAQRLADGGDGDGVVPGQVAGAAPGGAGAVDDDARVDGVQEAGERSGAAAGEVEPYVGVVATPERGQMHGRVGEQPVGDEAPEKTVGTEQQDPHRAAPCFRRAGAGG